MLVELLQELLLLLHLWVDNLVSLVKTLGSSSNTGSGSRVHNSYDGSCICSSYSGSMKPLLCIRLGRISSLLSGG